MVCTKTWWNRPFELSFSLSYFAIGPADRQDNRTISGGKRSLRDRYDLSFLNITDDSNAGSSTADSSPQETASLHEVVISLSLVGMSELYWTGICLKDEFHEEEPRLESEDELEESVGSVDPITFKEASRPTSSPRTYFLHSFARNVEEIVDQQDYIKDIFGANIPDPILARPISPEAARLWTKDPPVVLGLVKGRVTELRHELHNFLNTAAIASDGLPKAPSFQSLKDDRLAITSLKSLRQSHANLCELEKSFQKYITKCEGLRTAVSDSSLGSQSCNSPACASELYDPG